MIEIRPDQIQMFLNKGRTTFIGRVTAYLKSNHREWLQSMDKEALEALLRKQIAAAEGYGITTEVSVVQFIEAGLAYGPDFHSSGKYPEAERILLQNVDGGVKAQQLLQAAREGFKTAQG